MSWLSPMGPIGLVWTVAVSLLVTTYVYFWWNVVKATAHQHVNREYIDDDMLRTALALARGDERTHRFLIQITTKGGALAVVERGIDNVLDGIVRYPALCDVVRVEVITENGEEVQALEARYAGAAIRVEPILLPPDYRTPQGTALKARALHYMVERHRSTPDDCYVVHYDEESVLTPDNLARLVHRLLSRPVGISEGMISYGLDWDQATLLNKAMESARPFGCHECYSVMTSPPPLHLHGSNLVVRQDLENEIGWDIGNLDGSALVAEDLVFGLMAYLRYGPGEFGWHYAEMIEQPPFTVKDGYKQRERWVFGALQALAHVRSLPGWGQLRLRDRLRIAVIIRVRVLTYALGFPISLLALGVNSVVATMVALESVRVDQWQGSWPEWTVDGVLTVCGIGLWLGATQLGLGYNLRHSGLGVRQRVRDHLLVLLVTPIAGLVDTAGPLVAVLKWIAGIREVTWRPTPKSAPVTRTGVGRARSHPAPITQSASVR